MPPNGEAVKLKRIFVSYRSVEPDQTVARTVVEALKHEHEVFIAPDIRPGSDWGQSVEDALQRSNFLIAFISELAAKSPMVVAEIETAHARRVETGEPSIIPVRLGFETQLRYPLSAYINRFQHILWRDFKDTEQLIRVLKTILTSEPIRTPFGQTARPRLRAIQRVRHDWIDGYLKRSLSEGSNLDLSLVEDFALIEWPLDVIVQRPFQQPQRLAPGTRVTTIFDEHLGQLLIVGAPGSGKTTLLLELAEELLNRAERDANLPIPFVFNLASWPARRRSLADWLMDEMNMLYDVPEPLAQMWMAAEQILPLLDGLDEVAPRYRNRCVEAINTFRKDHGQLPIVVCSRSEEYENLTTRLRLPGAVVVQPLMLAQVRVYMASAGLPAEKLGTVLGEDSTLWDLLNTPLMVNIVVRACRDSHLLIVGRQPLTPGVSRPRDQLFARYVDAMFARRAKEQHFTREDTVLWLTWIASFMAESSQSILHVGDMDRNWLTDGSRKETHKFEFFAGSALYCLFVGLRLVVIYAILVGVGPGFGRGFVAGLILGAWEALLRSVTLEIPVWAFSGHASTAYGGRTYMHVDKRLAWHMRNRLRKQVGTAIVLGLIAGVTIGLASGLAMGVGGFKLWGLGVGVLLGLLNGLFFAAERADFWIRQWTLRFRLWGSGRPVALRSLSGLRGEPGLFAQGR